MTFTMEALTPETWPQVYDLLKPSMSDITAEALIDDLLFARSQLWVKRQDGNITAAAVTDRHGERLHCHLAGGRNAASWVRDLHESVMEVARREGIRRLTIEGRPGWERLIRGTPWKRAAVVLECEVDG